MKRFDDALISYDRALAIRQNYPEALNNRGNVLQALHRFDEALLSYDAALALKADYAEAQSNRGNVLKTLRRLDEALASYDRAVQLRPDVPAFACNRGNGFYDLGRYGEALSNYDRALSLNANYAEAHHFRGLAQQQMKRYGDAIASFDRALAVNPHMDFVQGDCLYCKLIVCDWRGLGDDFNRLGAAIAAGEKASTPFPLLVTPLSPEQQKAGTEHYVREMFAHTGALPPREGRAERKRLRLGYFSADFHNHATAYLTAELFECHDRSRFELIAFSFGPATRDPMRVRIEHSFDRFIDVSRLSNREIVLLARELAIDIAVDLKGFTKDARTEVFSLRAAPLQVSYLGYPGTMGGSFIDYLIADRIVIPEEERRFYAEKIVYLPDSYQVNDSKRPLAEDAGSRAAHGLPETGFVFCCFNSSYKTTPAVFDIWMRLLRRTDSSVLWLLEDNDFSAASLRAEAEARGVEAARLVFARQKPLPEHLARQRLADLFLDTLPYCAHTTASDALWAGLPVLTCLGETFAGRVAASLLNAVGLPELITDNLVEYEARAAELSSEPAKLAAIRRRLTKNRLSAPLFDSRRFTRHLEAGYQTMWGRYQAGLEPEHIFVNREN